MEKIRELLKKYRELISYLVFGVLTTLVNYVSYLLFAPLFPSTTTIPTAIAWVLSVIFAYVTNRIFVFRSEAKGAAALCGRSSPFLAPGFCPAYWIWGSCGSLRTSWDSMTSS